jgi:hypothetical protein
MKLIQAFASKFIDTRSELDRLAADRNLQIVGCGNAWMVLDTDCQIVAQGRDPVSALTGAMFGGR